MIWENNICFFRLGLRATTFWAMNGITFFCFVCLERKTFSCIHVQKWLRDVQSVNVNIGFCRYCKARLNFNVTSKYIGNIVWKFGAFSLLSLYFIIAKLWYKWICYLYITVRNCEIRELNILLILHVILNRLLQYGVCLDWLFKDVFCSITSFTMLIRYSSHTLQKIF